MRDTIGAHLAQSMVASMWREAWLVQARENGPRAEQAAIEAAKNEGAAAGHAFRAAELAYDAGQREGQQAVARDWERDDMARYGADYVGSSLYWNGEG